MPSSRTWANVLLVGSTFIIAYAVLGLALIHGHRAHERHARPEGPQHTEGHHHSHGPCHVEHFALLALVTGLTGAAAACMPSRRRMSYGFVIVLLLAELAVLAHISRGATHAVQRCTADAERVEVHTSVERAEIAPSVELVRERVSVSEPFVDGVARDQCVNGVRHAASFACLILGAICTALMCCSSRMTAAVEREVNVLATAEEGAVATTTEQGETTGERASLLKADPLAEYDEELATGKIAV